MPDAFSPINRTYDSNGVGARMPAAGKWEGLPQIIPPAQPLPQNANGRHHIPKMRHAVTNWAEYEGGLRRRGSLTLWVTEESITAWAAARRATTGGQANYSDSAIQTCLMLRGGCGGMRAAF